MDGKGSLVVIGVVYRDGGLMLLGLGSGEFTFLSYIIPLSLVERCYHSAPGLEGNLGLL
jgi:hypothetical protein